MKLKLTSHESVECLQIVPPMESHDTKVLRAGVSKLLRDGKSRILIDVSQANPLPKDLVLDLEELHAIAHELGGSVALAGIQPPSPPTGKLPVFPKPDEAIRFLRGGAPVRKAGVAEPSQAAAPAPSVQAPATQPAAASSSATKALSAEDPRKARIHSEQGELGKVRSELEKLKLEHNATLTRLADMLVERKQSSGLEVLKKKVEELEAELAQAKA